MRKLQDYTFNGDSPVIGVQSYSRFSVQAVGGEVTWFGTLKHDAEQAVDADWFELDTVVPGDLASVDELMMAKMFFRSAEEVTVFVALG